MEKIKDNREFTKEELDAICNGDKAVFKRLYDNYSGALYAMAIKIVISEDVAKDVLQDSFVKIWKNFHSFDSTKGRLFTWMANIVRNTSIDALRKKDAKYEIHVQDKFVTIADRQNNTSQNTDTLDVHDKIDTLSDEHQVVIRTVYLMGHTHEEAAKKLNLPLGTVKTRVRMAMIELKRIFGSET